MHIAAKHSYNFFELLISYYLVSGRNSMANLGKIPSNLGFPER